MTATPEFSRPFTLDRLGAATAEETVTATPEECAALARRLAIPAVASLACRWRLRRGAGGRIGAKGWLSARLVRECVVTLDEFTADASEKFHLSFVPAGKESDDLDPEAEDEVAYEGDVIDLGEATVEQLALSLDPYPRKPSAAVLDPAMLGAALPHIEDAAESKFPFAVLARRKPGH